MMGSECSGIVSEVGPDVKHVRPGDRVVAMAGSCFATSAVANAHSVTYLPESLGYAEGASIPIAYLTVDYALNHLARLSKGERVLIHAATGGIGLAAVQLARKTGAEIYATAGSHTKREYLKHLGIKHVMDSRNLDFVDEVKAWTDGEGVDVVLNSLAGEYVHASMNLLRPFGRFLELGKRDIYADSKLGLYPFRNNISYFGIDLGQLGRFRRDFLKKLFDRLMTKFATGELKPGPVNEYSIRDISKGFELMARSSHIGKIVFLVDDERDPPALKLEKFRSRFGEGIAVRDGLAVFDRLLSSDRTPSRVTATALPLTGSDTRTRYVHVPTLTRSVNTPFREPRNTNEEVLQQIWEKTLGLSPIGVDDDFRELGGDSLNAIMIQIAVQETFNVEVSLSSLFRYPTISKLSGRILKEAGASR
jgi:NADPH:quinone reductase-like Zn-dependent oxidoreductase/acyl carrier protein